MSRFPLRPEPRVYERFSSRGEADFADKVMSALRYEFGGHEEKSRIPREAPMAATPPGAQTLH